MKAATVKELKNELTNRSPKELLDICLRLSKFKKDNKELLTYLLFESANEANYIESIKYDIDEQFSQINTNSYYYIRKSVRKILSTIKKNIRYSQKKETEIEILLHFCTKLKSLSPSINRSTRLKSIYEREIARIKKAISTLHEDLQYDYNLELEAL